MQEELAQWPFHRPLSSLYIRSTRLDVYVCDILAFPHLLLLLNPPLSVSLFRPLLLHLHYMVLKGHSLYI